MHGRKNYEEGNILPVKYMTRVVYCVHLCFSVCNKSKFSSLESTQDAVGRPAVFCIPATGYHGTAR